jgi:hypothetical protein
MPKSTLSISIVLRSASVDLGVELFTVTGLLIILHTFFQKGLDFITGHGILR